MVAGEALEAEAVGIEAMELKAEKDASKRRAADSEAVRAGVVDTTLPLTAIARRLVDLTS